MDQVANQAGAPALHVGWPGRPPAPSLRRHRALGLSRRAALREPAPDVDAPVGDQGRPLRATPATRRACSWPACANQDPTVFLLDLMLAGSKPPGPEDRGAAPSSARPRPQASGRGRDGRGDRFGRGRRRLRLPRSSRGRRIAPQAIDPRTLTPFDWEAVSWTRLATPDAGLVVDPARRTRELAAEVIALVTESRTGPTSSKCGRRHLGGRPHPVHRVPGGSGDRAQGADPRTRCSASSAGTGRAPDGGRAAEMGSDDARGDT